MQPGVSLFGRVSSRTRAVAAVVRQPTAPWDGRFGPADRSCPQVIDPAESIATLSTEKLHQLELQMGYFPEMCWAWVTDSCNQP